MESKTKNQIVTQNEEMYDVSGFLKNHPGGYNYVQSYKGSKIRNKMVESYHSKSAMYLLREYKIGGRNHDVIEGEEDLEDLIDWSKPILHQVGRLGSQYNEWMSAPVDRKLRLFENNFLEALTLTPWYVVPIVWAPIILYLIYSGINIYTTNNWKLLFSGHYIPIILSFIQGLLLWTLLEYALHRWVFHRVPSGKWKIFIYFHFAIHGLHHKVPFDSRRLVFPPLPAAIIATSGYFIYSYIFPDYLLDLIAAGSISGYVIYDMIHFYLHYGAPKENTYLYTMKRYHNHHHFSHSESGFGISTIYWDTIFGTAIMLRKLAVGIKW